MKHRHLPPRGWPAPVRFRGMGWPESRPTPKCSSAAFAHLVSCRGTSTPSAAYSVILFRNVRTDTPSKRAEAVRFPSVSTSVSKIRSRSISRMGTPTNQRARRRRDAQEIGVWGEKLPMCVLHSNSAPGAPSLADYNKVNALLTIQAPPISTRPQRSTPCGDLGIRRKRF
jgi:hypothetical protein